VLPHHVQRHDVRVAQARRRTRLLEEALHAIAPHHRALDELQRHPPPERHVLRQVDLAHRALAEEPADLEVADARAFREQRVRSVRCWIPHAPQ
jgi:hypothetical protein